MPEINVADGAVVQDEDVARMRVGMEEAVDEELLEEEICAQRTDGFEVDVGGAEGFQVGTLVTVDVFHGQDAV